MMIPTPKMIGRPTSTQASTIRSKKPPPVSCDMRRTEFSTMDDRAIYDQSEISRSQAHETASNPKPLHQGDGERHG
jgi:hypothetical protein